MVPKENNKYPLACFSPLIVRWSYRNEQNNRTSYLLWR
jgi:hypothetical protein